QTVNGVKKVKPENYEDYAEHLNEFVTYMESRGVPIYAVSVQNEPDYDGGWTQWSASELLTFVRDYASFLITRVIAPESFQFRRALSDPILNDPIACENVDIIGGHIYGAGLAPYPLAKNKGKEVWMTEHYTDSQNSGNLWPLALEVGKEMHDVMCADMNAYVWWYIVRYYGPISDGTMDSGKKGEMTKRGYVMSHFSRFVRPGYRRLECTPRPQNSVYASAYVDSASTRVVLVVVNTSAFAKSQTFIFRDGRIERLIPYVTSQNANCERGQEIFLSSDTLKIELAARSIMTLVSDGTISLGLHSTKTLRDFQLLPNYPNPFNAVTAIRFRIPCRSDVALTIYNLRGEVLQKISCGIYEAGEHTIPFEAACLPSGIYLYRLTAGNFSALGRMVLAR
ncbi:MAG: T9SS type A sorting domain-containing protein, partial [candidate division KSB1 bacterium]|nr:T9SS type A sorting domain-containing protein [candidate division KSB1 bacterium]